LRAIADWARTTVEVIRQLNPALLRNVTPPHGKPFLLRLPAGKGSIFSAPYLGLPKIPQIRLLRPKAEEEETERLRTDLTPTANES
jgi:hypothetical protein